MDRFKALYKINGSTLSPKISKHKVVNELRATKRSQLYSSTRNLSPSPSPDKRPHITEEQKENHAPSLPSGAHSGLTSKDNLKNGENPAATEKHSRKKQYLMRFLKWKAEKAQEIELKNQKSKRAQFVVPCKPSAAAADSKAEFKKSFAPSNHVFVPPNNLKDVKVESVSENTFRCISGTQQVLYKLFDTRVKPTAVPKPPSKRIPPSRPCIPKSTTSVQKFTPKPPVIANSAANLPVKIPSSRADAQPKKISTARTTETRAVTASKRIPLAGKTPKTKPSESSKQPLVLQPKTNPTKTEIKPTKTPIRPPPLKIPPKSTENPKSLSRPTRMPPPSTTRQPPKVIKKSHETRAATSKTGTIKSGQPPLKRPTFKAPKKVSSSISKAFENVKRKKPDAIAPVGDTVPETPTEIFSADTLVNFVTSTRRKSSSFKDRKADLLFNEMEDTISPVEVVVSTAKVSAKKPESDKKFDFIRYSVMESDNAASPEIAAPCKVEPEEKPANYMSPYVSVSRGKVNVKMEREKRNSIYMTPVGSDDNAPTVLSRTLATVRYYRKQLDDEIGRLNHQCTFWERYREANSALIEDGGVDMINVTVGQTKLLITKKLKQFGTLIDRCENGALGRKAENAGDGEGAKPILPEDLEGFWSMVGLQIENIDKRFSNLERWKANNWSDPDDVPRAINANPKKVKKRKPVAVTARPSASLLKMLKAAHAGYVNKKTTNDPDEDVILTPSKRKIVIKDRRSRSAAATVITVTTPVATHKLNAQSDQHLIQTPPLIPHINNFRKSMSLFKTALINEQTAKSPRINGTTPVKSTQQPYKPILKTPASTRKQKSVGFSTEINKKSLSPSDMSEDIRAYKLRNRRVILRDSSEFVIPK